MYPLMENTADEFVIRLKEILKKANNTKKHIEKETDNNANYNKVTGDDVNELTVNGEKLIGGYTADAIVPCAFGVRSAVMDNQNDPFAVALHAFYEMSFSNICSK